MSRYFVGSVFILVEIFLALLNLPYARQGKVLNIITMVVCLLCTVFIFMKMIRSED